MDMKVEIQTVRAGYKGEFDGGPFDEFLSVLCLFVGRKLNFFFLDSPGWSAVEL